MRVVGRLVHAMKTLVKFCIPLVVLVSCETSSPPRLEDGDRANIAAALRSEHLPSPKTLELTSSGWLVATFELAPEEFRGSGEDLAEKALLAIRNTMYRYKPMHAYRVTLNGPSPGPGLIRRYGSARFIEEGGKIEWDAGK